MIKTQTFTPSTWKVAAGDLADQRARSFRVVITFGYLKNIGVICPSEALRPVLQPRIFAFLGGLSTNLF